MGRGALDWGKDQTSNCCPRCNFGVDFLEGENMSLRVENCPNVTIFTHHRVRHELVMCGLDMGYCHGDGHGVSLGAG